MSLHEAPLNGALCMCGGRGILDAAAGTKNLLGNFREA